MLLGQTLTCCKDTCGGDTEEVTTDLTFQKVKDTSKLGDTTTIHMTHKATANVPTAYALLCSSQLYLKTRRTHLAPSCLLRRHQACLMKARHVPE